MNAQTYFKVHNYLVGEQIAKGSFSNVRVCYKNGSSKVFAMKAISKKKIAQFASFRAIEFNEGLLSPLLLHPNIMKVKEVIDSKNQLFVISQFCTGGDLLHVLRQKQLSKATCLKLANQLISAIAYLKDNHICHRDIKLENLFLTKNNDLLVSDFGLASLTLDGIVEDSRGSMQYVAPEALKQKRYNGFQADIWSIAVVLYCVFTRRCPYTCQDSGYNFNDPIDFSFLDSDVEAFLKPMFSFSPEKRPTIEQLLNHPIFDQLPAKSNYVQYPVNIDHPFDDLNDSIVSRLGQILDLQWSDTMKMLTSPFPNEAKVIYVLLEKRIPTMVNSRSGDFTAIAQYSSYPGELSRSHDSKNEDQTAKDSIRCFNTSSCDLLKAVDDFLYPMNGCVTAPSVFNRTIVVNTVNKDKKVEFECLDLSDQGCSLAFKRDNESSTLPDELIGFLNNKFPSCPITGLLA